MNSKITPDEQFMALAGKMAVWLDRLGECMRITNVLALRNPSEKIINDMEAIREEMVLEVLKLKEGGVA